MGASRFLGYHTTVSQEQHIVIFAGKPVITNLSEQHAEDAKHKVLTCEAEGVPEPNFRWNINTTNVSKVKMAENMLLACMCV